MATSRISILLALAGLSIWAVGCVATADSSADSEDLATDEDALNNLLKHGDFEGVKENSPPPSWKVVISGSGHNDAAFVDKDSAYQSKRGLRVIDDSGAGERITVTQIVPVEAKGTYRLTARTRRVQAEHVLEHNDGSSQRLVLQFLDANKKLIQNPHCNFLPKYCHSTYTADPPSSTTKFALLAIGSTSVGVEAPHEARFVSVQIKGNATQGEYRDWDNIILKQVGWAGE